MIQTRATMLTSSEWGCSHRRLGTWREFPQQVMLWVNILKEVSSKLTSGQQRTCQWWLSTTPLTMDGGKRTASYFPFGSRCPSPRMHFIWMWSALIQVPALGASARGQSWSAHVFASVNARSSWPTIGRPMCVYNWFICNFHITLFRELFKQLSEQLCVPQPHCRTQS